MQDDFRLRGQHRLWPKAMQRTKRLLKIVLGFTLLAIGASVPLENLEMFERMAVSFPT